MSKQMCNQNCGKTAEVYGGDNIPSGWAGFYCRPCLKELGFSQWSVLPDDEEEQQNYGTV